MDLPETWLEPLSGSDPAGPEMLYTEASRRKARDGLDSPETSQDALYGIVAQLEAEALKTRDIELPILMMLAGGRLGDLARIELGARYLLALVETMWKEIHPRIEVSLRKDKDTGAEIEVEDADDLRRKHIVDSLGEYAFLDSLQRVPLVDGNRSLRLWDVTEEDLDPYQNLLRTWVRRFKPSQDAAILETLKRLWTARPDKVAATKQQIEAIQQALSRVDDCFQQHGRGNAPLEDTHACLRNMSLFLDMGRPTPPTEDRPEADTAAPVDQVSTTEVAMTTPPAILPSREAGAPVVIASRAEAKAMLNAVCDFYKSAEPHSPMPLLLGRAISWIEKDFMGLLADIVPESAEAVGRSLGAPVLNDQKD